MYFITFTLLHREYNKYKYNINNYKLERIII